MNLFHFFDRLALWKKFLCLGVICLATIILPTLLYWNEVRKIIAFSELEQQGLEPTQLMLNIIQRTQQHRGLSVRYLTAANTSKQERRTKAAELNEAFTTYSNYLHKNNDSRMQHELNQIIAQWNKTNLQANDPSATADQSFAMHGLLIRHELNALQKIVDTYQLSLDPESDGYFLISASLMDLPEVTEELGQIRALGSAYLAQGKASIAERSQLKSLLLLSKDKIAEMEINIDKAAAANYNKRSNIFENYRATQLQFQNIVALTQNEIIEQETLSYKPDEFFSAFTYAINSYFTYAHFSIEQINGVLQDRITEKKNTMYGLLSYIALITFFLAFVCIKFTRKLLRQLGGEPSYATEVVQTITRGDLQQQIVTHYPDSLLANMHAMQKKLNENDKLKNEFISTVSHELRTPLTAISGALALTLSGKLGEMPERSIGMLDIAHKNSLRLTELINDLLDIDKLVAGKLILDLKPQPLMPIIEEAITSMTAYAEKFSVQLLLTVNAQDIQVNVDARRVQQVLINFISNAAKFSHAGERIDISVSVKHSWARIEVVDYGQGIPEKFHSRIFQKFSQADSSDTRKVGGTGLGLAISKELITQMSGKIGFHSTPGIGSRFFFKLPLISNNLDNQNSNG